MKITSLENASPWRFPGARCCVGFGVKSSRLSSGHSKSDASDLDDIRKTLQTLGTFEEKKIFRDSIVNGSGTTFTIAKRLGKRQSMLEDPLNDLVGESVLDMDDGGYCLSASADETYRVRKAIEKRIAQLGYEDELELADVVDHLF